MMEEQQGITQDQRIANTILQLLQRLDLKGSEVQTYVHINQWLGNISKGATELRAASNPVPPETLQPNGLAEVDV